MHDMEKQILTARQYEIWSRTQLKKANVFHIIAKDLWISKQAVHQDYKKSVYRIKTLIDKIKNNV